jgi:anti-sigma factor RsiW
MTPVWRTARRLRFVARHAGSMFSAADGSLAVMAPAPSRRLVRARFNAL